MRRVDEALQSFGQPMIAPGLPAVAVHPLLDHDPAAIVGDDEAVQIEIKPVLHGGAVDLGDQPAGFGQRRAVQADPIADREARAASAANACRGRRRHGCRVRRRAGSGRASTRRGRWW